MTWIGYVSIRTGLLLALTPGNNYCYMQVDDFYRQRKPNKTYGNLQYRDTHVLGVL